MRPRPAVREWESRFVPLRIMTATFFRRRGQGGHHVDRDEGRRDSPSIDPDSLAIMTAVSVVRVLAAQRVEFEQSRHQPSGAVTKDAYLMVKEELLALLVCPMGKAPFRREGDS